MMALFHSGMLVSQHAQYQGPVPETPEWNADIINVISYVFNTVICPAIWSHQALIGWLSHYFIHILVSVQWSLQYSKK